MHLEQLICTVHGFSSLDHVKKIEFFAWFLHSVKKREYVTASEIAGLYDDIHLDRPTNLNPYLSRLARTRPRRMLHKPGIGYKLEHRARQQWEEQCSSRPATLAVHQLLADLPTKLKSEHQRVFLEEVLQCFGVKAFRASVVMAWNLAFDHLCHHILDEHLKPFNEALVSAFPKGPPIAAVKGRVDFEDLKEFDVLRIARRARVLTQNQKSICDEKLRKRNIFAHPSSAQIQQLQAEEYITDLVQNVVLALS